MGGMGEGPMVTDERMAEGRMEERGREVEEDQEGADEAAEKLDAWLEEEKGEDECQAAIVSITKGISADILGPKLVAELTESMSQPLQLQLDTTSSLIHSLTKREDATALPSMLDPWLLHPIPSHRDPALEHATGRSKRAAVLAAHQRATQMAREMVLKGDDGGGGEGVGKEEGKTDAV